MSKLPSMPLFIDVFVADTVHLSNEQLGMYVRLLCFAWTKNGSGIQDDAELINRVCLANTEKEKQTSLSIIDEFFELRLGDTPEENRWYNKRLEKEWNYTIDLVNKRSIAGTKSATKRQQTANKTSTPRPIPKPIPINIFNIWWSKINNKIGKGQAEKTFCKGFLNEDFPELENKDTFAVTVLLDNLAELYNKHCADKKEFAQHPSTWLNAKGYLDKPMEFKEKNENYGLPRQKNFRDYVSFVKKGVHTTYIDDTMVRQMYKEGLISKQELKDYGC